MTTFIHYIIKMTDKELCIDPEFDPEMESESQAIANYEDELAEFINKYKGDKELREQIRDKYGLFITYEEYDECWGLFGKNWLIRLEREVNKLIEKIYNIKDNVDYSYMLEEMDLPF